MQEIFRNIIYTARRFRLATMLNIIGLTVAFASFYLLLTQISYQYTYNHGLKGYRQLYRLESDYEYQEWDYSDNVCRPFAEALRRLRGFESLSLMRDTHDGSNYTFTFLKGPKKLKYDISWCNETALSTLTDQLIDGRLEWTAADTADLRIIPASIAKEYFGTTKAAGKTMAMLSTDSTGKAKELHFTVMGVYEDFPENSELSNCIYGYMGDIDSHMFWSRYKCYVKFTGPLENSESMSDSIKQAILDDLDAKADKYGQRLEENKEIISKTKFKLTPLDSSFFEYSTYTSGDSGFMLMLTILMLACLLVIVIATINFLNFTLAESPMRMHSVNTHLVLGADRSTIRLKLVAECVILSVVTCLAGLAICDMLHLQPTTRLPLIGSLAVADHLATASFTMALALLVGVVAGVYPAIFATSFPPAMVLKGSFGLTPKGHSLRTTLVCLQLFITLLMVTYIGILLLQSRHILSTPYGYDKDQLLYANLKEYLETPEREELEQELMRIPDVEGVTYASTMLGATDGHYMIKARFHGRLMGYNVTYIDHDFMRTMGIEIVEGRDFNDNDEAAVIINEAARRQWTWLNLGDCILTTAEDDYIDSARVVGVCKNIRYGTLRVNSNQPFAFILDREIPGDKVIVRVAAGSDMGRTCQQANQVVQAFRNDVATLVDSYDNGVADSYHNEFRFFSQVYLITFLCLVITLIGLFCITMFETEYRRKEIGIRKVAGATTGEIVWMLCRHYGWLILMSFAVAAPVAWYFGYKTLDHFAERTAIFSHWWIFPLSLTLVGGTMLGTVALQAWLAAHKNPAATIKTE